MLKKTSSFMKLFNLQARVKKKFKATTNSNHNLPIAENVLNRNFSVSKPNTCYVGDITYIATKEGWLYLATVIDLHSRAVVGWSMKDRIDAELTCKALQNALKRRKIKSGLHILWHSDRGSQYASLPFQILLKKYGITCSMSRKGNCWDNSVAESFFASLKKEATGSKVFETREEAKAEIFSYIECFYNTQRKHSTLGYLAPFEFEKNVSRAS